MPHLAHTPRHKYWGSRGWMRPWHLSTRHMAAKLSNFISSFAFSASTLRRRPSEGLCRGPEMETPSPFHGTRQPPVARDKRVRGRSGVNGYSQYSDLAQSMPSANVISLRAGSGGSSLNRCCITSGRSSRLSCRYILHSYRRCNEGIQSLRPGCRRRHSFLISYVLKQA